jgi:hypothetical protein
MACLVVRQISQANDSPRFANSTIKVDRLPFKKPIVESIEATMKLTASPSEEGMKES